MSELTFRTSSVSDFGGKKKEQEWSPGRWDRPGCRCSICNLWVRPYMETKLRVDVLNNRNIHVMVCDCELKCITNCWKITCLCSCVFQVFYHRSSEPYLLPADGGVDARNRPALHSQTSATGSAYFCPWLSADVLLCYEHPGGRSSQKLSPLPSD